MLRRLLVATWTLAATTCLAAINVRDCVVVTQPGASAQETFAAHELRDYLSKITGAEIPIVSASIAPQQNSIVIGPGPLASKLLPDTNWKQLGPEQTLIRSVGRSMVVAGGPQRGTLYAVYRLLQVKCGVRWWAPWATTVPKNPTLTFGLLNWSESPAFEYRDPYWAHAFDANWATRNFDNGFNTRVDEKAGGKTVYEGFVHTYDGLVPPDKYFPIHPEWFSLINGKRTAANAQLCTTNPELREFVVEQVKQRLRANPKATIVSVSQNDCYNPCTCPVCRALARQEGSDSALVLDLANYVADRIKTEFPTVAVDTLAYQWSRHPPREMKPRPNVIVRLCSIECNFAQPLFAPANQSFADDIRGWKQLTNRLYIWDYCTDFAHYLQPEPDYFALGPTIRWFSENGVKGVFEEGDYSSRGGDMAELKAWVIAQMLWNPKQDPEALVAEFLQGYYGPAAEPINEYLHLMTNEAQTTHVSFALGSDAKFLRYEVMSKAQKLWAKARELVATMPDFAARVKLSSLSPDSIWLSRWAEFRYEAAKKADPWPYANTRQTAAGIWLGATQKAGDLDAAPLITVVDEGGTSPQAFVTSLGPEPELHEFHALPARLPNPGPPPGLPAGIDYQDDLANLWQIPTGSELRADRLASDRIACWMPATHHEWAFQMPLSKKPVSGRYRIYAVVRVDTKTSDDTPAFWSGVYDNAAKRDLANKQFKLSDVAPGYTAFVLGSYDVTPDLTVWVAPAENPSVRAVWVDRIYLVKE